MFFMTVELRNELYSLDDEELGTEQYALDLAAQAAAEAAAASAASDSAPSKPRITIQLNVVTELVETMVRVFLL